MPAGRPPKPTAIKKLEGNPGKRKLNNKEPKPTKESFTSPDSRLVPEGKRVWKRICTELNALGLLTVLDREALYIYCDAFSRLVEARKFLKENGETFEGKDKQGFLKIQRYPQVQTYKECAEICSRIGSRFGLSPSDRVRLAVEGGDSTDLDDETEQLLFKTS